ncbi:MAG TPA: sigma-70 family RNA polymerase sigma factor [Kofleriaceae bacterium]
MSTSTDSQPLADSSSVQLDEIVRSARLAWPTVELRPEQFVTHLVRHLPDDVPVATALAQMHTDDLYLARACELGDKHAVLAFEQHCMTGLETALFRYRAFSDLAAEVKQRVREYLLVGNASPPGIESFSGRGDLRSWVRIIAVREAINMVRQLQRRSRRETAIDDDSLLQGYVTPGDAELEHMKARYVEEFKQAFSAALRGLPARDQIWLRQHVIDGLSIDQLGALYRVHRATAARNLQRARRAVLMATRERMASRLQVGSSELDSILRMIRSRLQVTLRWLIRRRRKDAL